VERHGLAAVVTERLLLLGEAVNRLRFGGDSGRVAAAGGMGYLSHFKYWLDGLVFFIGHLDLAQLAPLEELLGMAPDLGGLAGRDVKLMLGPALAEYK
jgi:hypothetical protein